VTDFRDRPASAMEPVLTVPPRFEASPRECWVLLGLAAVFLVLNVATADLFPVVWVDEVMYIDPAVNLYLGHGFRSTA